MSSQVTILSVSLVAGLILGSINIVWSAEEHKHDGHEKTSIGITLNNGKPWQTDGPLRKGMDSIRHGMEAMLPRIHDASLSGDQYASLAKSIHDHIDYMVKNCKLSPEVDAQLHLVLGDIIEGANAMEGKRGQLSGATLIVKALNAYGSHFDHPGWVSLSH